MKELKLKNYLPNETDPDGYLRFSKPSGPATGTPYYKYLVDAPEVGPEIYVAIKATRVNPSDYANKTVLVEDEDYERALRMSKSQPRLKTLLVFWNAWVKTDSTSPLANVHGNEYRTALQLVIARALLAK